MPTNLVDRRTKYYSQASHLVRPHQSFCLHTNTRIGHQTNSSRTFIKKLNFLWSLNLLFFIVSFFSLLSFLIPVLLILPSLFSYPYSYPLHFPSFSYVAIYCSPSQLLFLPLLIHSFPVFTSFSHPPPTCHHTIPPSYTLTTHRLTYCTNFTQPQRPAIPDTITLHYNNRNTTKHTQGPQNPVAPITLPQSLTPFLASTFLVPPFNSPNL
jgi:hypothetical protein